MKKQKTKESQKLNQEPRKTRRGVVIHYPIGDFLIRVKNAAMVGKREVTLPSTKQIMAAASALKKAGFLEDFSQKAKVLTVNLAFRRKEPLLMGLRIISRPGLKIYMGVDDIEKKKGPSMYLISSPKGIISSRDALKLRSGGEVIAEVW